MFTFQAFSNSFRTNWGVSYVTGGSDYIITDTTYFIPANLQSDIVCKRRQLSNDKWPQVVQDAMEALRVSVPISGGPLMPSGRILGIFSDKREKYE